MVLCTEKEDTQGVFRALAASFRKYKMLWWTISASDAQAKKAFQIDRVLRCESSVTNIAAFQLSRCFQLTRCL